MKILVCGSRVWINRWAIRNVLSQYQYEEAQPVIIHGACPDGADKIADEEAKLLNYKVESYPACWTIYGKAAGNIRNQQMLDEGKPDLVLAFHIGNSPGTLDMIMRSKCAKIPIRIFKVKNAKPDTKA